MTTGRRCRSAASATAARAKTLTATTIALLRAKPTQFAPAAVRTALREWAFNTNRRPDALYALGLALTSPSPGNGSGSSGRRRESGPTCHRSGRT